MANMKIRIILLSYLLLTLIGSSGAIGANADFEKGPAGIYQNYIKVGVFHDSTISRMSREEFSVHVDEFARIGFTGVMFEITLSINESIEYYDGISHEKIYDFIEIAEGKGMYTAILPNWTFNGDNAGYVEQYVMPNYGIDPDSFDYPKFLSVIEEYWITHTSVYRNLGVDLINFGLFNSPVLFSERFVSRWYELIKQIRQVYDGALSVTFSKYTRHNDYLIDDFKIWSELDVIPVWAKITLDETQNYDLDDLLVKLIDTPQEPTSIYEQYKKASEEFSKPLMIMTNAFALDNGLDGGWDPTIEQLCAYPESLNQEMLKLAYETSFHFFSLHLTDYIASWGIGNWEAWALNQEASSCFRNWQYFDITRLPQSTRVILEDLLEDNLYIATSEIKYNLSTSLRELEFPNKMNQDLSIVTNSFIKKIRLGGGNDAIKIEKFPDTIKIDYGIYFTETQSSEFDFTVLVDNEQLARVTFSELSCSAGETAPCWIYKSINVPLPHIDFYDSLDLSVTNGFIDLINAYIVRNSVLTEFSYDNTSRQDKPDWVVSESWFWDSVILDISSINYVTEPVKFIDGGLGDDKIILPYNLGEADGKLKLSNIEKAVFLDTTVAYGEDVEFVISMLGAIAGELAAEDPEFITLGLSLLENGLTKEELSIAAVRYVLGELHSADETIALLFRNILGREPSFQELETYRGAIDVHSPAYAAFLVNIFENPIVLEKFSATERSLQGVIIN